jgi:hypothetical protein
MYNTKHPSYVVLSPNFGTKYQYFMKKIFLMLGLVALAFNSIAQEVYSSSGRPVDDKKKYDDEEVKGFDPSKLIFGGGFVFGIGGGVTNLGVMPVIGYRFTDKFAAGIGLGYQYYKAKDVPIVNGSGLLVNTADYKTSIYKGSIWARYMLFRNIFVHLEPEMNSLEKTPEIDPVTLNFRKADRIFVPSLLAGAGLRQPISDRVSFVAMVLYDVLQEPYSPYLNTIDLRIGVNVGF